ncbi:hypothetical protein SH528x_003880 [Novipirellula sp. SH528]|uniref:hypothetical protein n=1 Tax=Novipirellula sp. SH528 TaxID=3454466 RepID=UPI003FA04F5F
MSKPYVVVVAIVFMVDLQLLVIGAMVCCEDKGDSRTLGLLGDAVIMGFTLLFVLPDKHDVA